MKNLNEELLAYYEDHPDDFADDLEVLDSLNGCLGDERCRPMASLGDLLGDKSAGELLNLGACSSDEDSGPFDPTRDYVYRNGHGGLVSTDYRDYTEEFLRDDVVQDILDNINHLTLSVGAQTVVEKWELVHYLFDCD